MKGKEFAELLRDLSVLLRDASAAEAADTLKTLVPIFDSAPKRDVGAICSVLNGLGPPAHNNELRLRQMLRLFPALRQLLQRAKASKATVNDLDVFSAALQEHSERSASDITDAAVKRLREQTTTGPTDDVSADALVNDYCKRLEEALRNEDRFAEVFRELKSDQAIKPTEAKKLAKLFAKETARSRDHALKLIWSRHSALIGARARQKANKGRTAA